jgi:predicted transcriptional regulator
MSMPRLKACYMVKVKFTPIRRKKHSGQVEMELYGFLTSAVFSVYRANITILQYYNTASGVIRDEESIIY